MIQRLHKLSPFLSFMFVRYSDNLIVHLWQGGRGRVSGSEIITGSHLLQYLCWNMRPGYVVKVRPDPGMS